MIWTQGLALPVFDPGLLTAKAPAGADARSVIETNLAHCGEDALRLRAKHPVAAIREVVRLRGWMHPFQQAAAPAARSA